jgi:hypothetical protein
MNDSPITSAQAVQTIPDGLTIECPQTGFKIRYAKACAKCTHLRGVYPIPDVPESAEFHFRYRITCAYPISRGLTVILDG